MVKNDFISTEEAMKIENERQKTSYINNQFKN